MIADAWAQFVIKYNSSTRIDFYRGFQNLVENGLSVNDCLKELYYVWSYDKKKPNEPLAIVTRDLLVQLSNGTPLSRALSRWVPYEEASLLAAGEQAARMVESCDDVVRVITAKQKISGAIRTAVLYPSLLSVPLAVLLWIIATQMVPQMAKLSNPETWTGASYMLYLIASMVINYGIAIVCLIIAIAVGFTFSLPRLTGGVRAVLDKGPFYSMYRMVHGSTFLLNLAVMMRANIPMYKSLELLGEYANPWLKERIEGALYGIRMGSDLGVALDNAGHQFPDKKAIPFIRILASREGFSKAINNYSERWLQTSIQRIEAAAKASLSLMLILIGVVMALVVVGTQDMQSNIEKSANRQSSQIVQP